MLYVSVQGFAGLEEGQARRLEFKDIVLRSAGVEPHILVEETGGFKDPLTGEVRKRIHKAPILPPLEDLFAKVKRKLPRRRIFPTKSIRYKARRAAKEAGLRWIQGGLRSTFIAKRLAEGHELAEVAYESGIVFERDIKCFIGLVEESDARAYGRIKIEPGRRAYTWERINWEERNMKSSPQYHPTPC
jgi:hypothetical protein